MVYGLERFKDYFKDHETQYVFIGGTACEILMNDFGFPFRATKDLDIVLIIEALDAFFVTTFWNFIIDGGYEHPEKSYEKNQFYRFYRPKEEGYPKMIELFCRKPEGLQFNVNQKFTPIHIDDSIVSLSAILLNEEYYKVLTNNRTTIDGYSVLDIGTLILFKIKAWLDMTERKKNFNHVDSKNLKKHKNDIFKLLASIQPSSPTKLSKEIMKDVGSFIELVQEDQPKLRDLGLENTNFDEIMKILKSLYL